MLFPDTTSLQASITAKRRSFRTPERLRRDGGRRHLLVTFCGLPHRYDEISGCNFEGSSVWSVRSEERRLRLEL